MPLCNQQCWTSYGWGGWEEQRCRGTHVVEGRKRELQDYPGVMGEIVCKYLLHQRNKLVFKRKDNASHSPWAFLAELGLFDLVSSLGTALPVTGSGWQRRRMRSDSPGLSL